MAVVDPVSQGAQKASTIVKVLHRVLNARVRIFLNCVDKHSEMPQKSYFRMVLRPEMTFDDDDHSSLAATFEDLPKSPIYTMHHHVPENWLTGVAKKRNFTFYLVLSKLPLMVSLLLCISTLVEVRLSSLKSPLWASP